MTIAGLPVVATWPVTLRGAEGRVTVRYGVNEDPVRWGFDLLGLDFDVQAARGFPVLRATATSPDGTVLSPTGKSFDLDFATTARWEGELMVEEYVFWDSALQARQVGLAG